MLRLWSVLFVNALIASCFVGVGDAQVDVRGHPGRAYVPSSDGNFVSVVDLNDWPTTATISGTFPGPWGVAITADGSKLYLANHGFGESTVSVVDIATNQHVTDYPAGRFPIGIAVTPDGKKVYVANSGSGSVTAIATTNPPTIKTISGFGFPQTLAMSPSGDTVYLASANTNAIYVIDTESDSVVHQIPMPDHPVGVAVSPDGNRLYVAGHQTNVLIVVDLTTDYVTTFPSTGAGPEGVAVSPDGSTVVVSNTNGNAEGGSITVYATANLDAGGTNIKVGAGQVTGAIGASFNSDGRLVYVAHFGESALYAVDPLPPPGTDPIRGSVGVASHPVAFGEFVYPPRPIADLRLDLKAPKNFNPNESPGKPKLIHYEHTVTNDGPNSAIAVTVKNTLVSSVEFLNVASEPPGVCSISKAPSSDGRVQTTVTCNVGNLVVGSDVGLTVTVQPNPAVEDTIENTAKVFTGYNVDPTPERIDAFTNVK